MSRIVIKGGKRLSGTVRVHGAKNAVLPILAATVLTKNECIIHNCPNLSDVNVTIDILRCLGAEVTRENDTIRVDASGKLKDSVPEELMHKLRSSIVFMGAVLARCGRAKISSPGGCELGPRPIDLHIKALRSLGVVINEKDGYLECDAEEFAPGEIILDFPSVGATENIMLASCSAPGVTTIKNAAKEPEIEDLACFLNAMGAKVSGAGTDFIKIEGTKNPKGVEYSIMPDRIAAVTYLCCAAVTGGEITVKDANPDHLSACFDCLARCGCDIAVDKSSITLKAPRRLSGIDMIETKPYPGFPTDAQSLFLAMLCTAEGRSMIVENIFKSRFKAAESLRKMGADISLSDRTAYIKGKKYLRGTKVYAADLRGGAGLVIAALAAKGITEIENPCYIDRGYENLVGNLSGLGAAIMRLED